MYSRTVFRARGGGGFPTLRGRADRVDEAEGGTLVVVDYETGSATDYKGLARAAPTSGVLSRSKPAPNEKHSKALERG